ncbi:unnamed protein product [Caenorhabditis bovis]|uniref:Beta-lactamase-related domain-containing protein n=1 Tax=Caenorhabditis bovis TaxID=2654633 RepID=A0A8S1F4P5_9PELO|nr:unnamed protein product [Caenorhabditis bovis]
MRKTSQHLCRPCGLHNSHGSAREKTRPSCDFQKKTDVLEDPANSNARSDEFLSNKKYRNVTEALEMFKNDDLVAEPGKKFSYTTHGLTLASAVIEKAAGRDFPTLTRELFAMLGMRSTRLDTKERIVPNRASYYRRNELHVLENCPEVDCSYKWAGGGILSNVLDLLKFGNAILYSTQTENSDALLSKSTICKLLYPHMNLKDGVNAGLGWFIVDGHKIQTTRGSESLGGYFYHTGGAVGASSVLLVRPRPNEANAKIPNGTCVAILCNLQETSVLSLAAEIEEVFR